MTKIHACLPLLVLLFSACGTSSVIEVSRSHARLGEFQHAFEVLDQARNQELLAGNTPDEELEAAYREARLASLLDRARSSIFAEREDDALADLATLEELAPGYPEAARLRERAIHKKAMRSVELGDDYLLRKDLENALASYLAAERVIPGFPPAVDGSNRVREALGRLTARAQSQFLEAVRKLPEFRYVEVRWHTDIALTNDPNRGDAEMLRDRARRELALRALARGRECQKRDQFGASLLEFRTARKLDPTLPGIDDEIAQAECEVEAARLVERAQRSMRTAEFDQAREQLGKAFELSKLARGNISELMIQTRRAEGEMRYQLARDLEVLGKKSEALAAYEALGKEWPEGLLDEKARIEGLRVDLLGAETEWNAAEAAEKAGDLPGALLHYETAMRYYAGWKDGQARIDQLRARIQGAAGREGPKAR